MAKRAVKTTLATGLRTQSAARETVRLRQVLVSVEVGAAVVLLLAAGLLLQSAARLLAIEVGAGQAAAVAALMGEAEFVRVQTRRDLAGIERVVVGSR